MSRSRLHTGLGEVTWRALRRLRSGNPISLVWAVLSPAKERDGGDVRMVVRELDVLPEREASCVHGRAGIWIDLQREDGIAAHRGDDVLHREVDHRSVWVGVHDHKRQAQRLKRLELARTLPDVAADRTVDLLEDAATVRGELSRLSSVEAAT